MTYRKPSKINLSESEMSDKNKRMLLRHEKFVFKIVDKHLEIADDFYNKTHVYPPKSFWQSLLTEPIWKLIIKK